MPDHSFDKAMFVKFRHRVSKEAPIIGHLEMVAYWTFPQRCSQTIKWLIVYVMLSRPRSLASVQSVGLISQIRSVLEEGPPEELVANFRKLFSAKIEDTKAEAIRAAKHYGLLPELF